MFIFFIFYSHVKIKVDQRWKVTSIHKPFWLYPTDTGSEQNTQLLTSLVPLRPDGIGLLRLDLDDLLWGYLAISTTQQMVRIFQAIFKWCYPNYISISCLHGFHKDDFPSKPSDNDRASQGSSEMSLLTMTHCGFIFKAQR